MAMQSELSLESRLKTVLGLHEGRITSEEPDPSMERRDIGVQTHQGSESAYWGDPSPQPYSLDNTTNGLYEVPAEPEIIDETPRPPDNAKFEEIAFNSSGFKIGAHAPENTGFVAWRVIGAYPSKWIGKGNRLRCTPWFEKRAQIFPWTIFYLHNPEQPTGQAYLFVPAKELENFLFYINTRMGTKLKIPSGEAQREIFNMLFGEADTPRPRFLGKMAPPGPKSAWRRGPSATKDNLRTLLQSLPPCSLEDKTAYKSASLAVRKAFSEMLQMLKASGFPIKDKVREAKARERAVKRTAMTMDLKRWLGNHPDAPELDPNIVFVSLDIEWIEYMPDWMSEIGIVILDVQDIVSQQDMRTLSHMWVPKLAKAHHIRVEEYAHLRNKKFVKGCPDRFNFGRSMFIAEDDIAKAISDIMKPYTSEKNPRTIVLVGHDVGQDVTHLEEAGIPFKGKYNITQTADTKDIHQQIKGLQQGASLRNVLADMSLKATNLHNAGNDAFYTLQALVALAFTQQV